VSRSPGATVGGQAVIEGVMMRAPSRWAVAVRRQDGVIEVASHDLPRLSSRSVWARVPFIRGVLVLGESLGLGFRALSWSAQRAGGEDGAATKKSEVAIAMVLALVFFVAVFMVLPLLAAKGLTHFLGDSPILFNVIDGIIRLALFIGYIWVIGLSSEIRRVFEYHGAEHKTIHAYEAGEPLTVETIQTHSPQHTRCGTNFLLIVAVIAMIAFTALGRPALPWLIASRLVGIPIIAGIAYEILKASADRRWLRMASVPGMWLQHLTTRDPKDEQIEVAVASLLASLADDERDAVGLRGPIPRAALEAEHT
jgi:uncharacterized protein YqhQ